jgi:transcription elongation GreA/GreB family factor
MQLKTMTLKQKIHQQYSQLLQDKIDVFKDMIVALTEDAKNDAKGSAGDKHETALSMMHLEQEKLNRKLKEYLDQKGIVDKIDSTQNSNKISLGSLVQTNGMLLFVSTALPKITVEEKTILAVSPQSPLGSQLLGKDVGYSFKIHGTSYLIESIT